MAKKKPAAKRGRSGSRRAAPALAAGVRALLPTAPRRPSAAEAAGVAKELRRHLRVPLSVELRAQMPRPLTANDIQKARAELPSKLPKPKRQAVTPHKEKR